MTNQKTSTWCTYHCWDNNGRHCRLGGAIRYSNNMGIERFWYDRGEVMRCLEFRYMWG
jgi:hypothetical protein